MPTTSVEESLFGGLLDTDTADQRPPLQRVILGIIQAEGPVSETVVADRAATLQVSRPATYACLQTLRSAGAVVETETGQLTVA